MGAEYMGAVLATPATCGAWCAKANTGAGTAMSCSSTSTQASTWAPRAKLSGAQFMARWRLWGSLIRMDPLSGREWRAFIFILRTLTPNRNTEGVDMTNFRIKWKEELLLL